MRSILLIFILISTYQINWGQDRSIFSKSDKVVIRNSAKFGFYYSHQFKEKQTLYSLSKVFGSNVDEIYAFNPSLRERSVQINETIIIPVRTRNIITNVPNSDIDTYIPVYYEVNNGDNLFQIARKYFYQPISSLIDRNNLPSVNVSLGQLLHVGWIALNDEGSYAQIIEKADSTHLMQEILRDTSFKIVDEDYQDDEVAEPITTYTMKKLRGIAMWNKNSTDKSNLFVLHPTAVPNSTIELYNPMLDRKVYAKVAGKLMPNLYPNDIGIVISPRVALELGMTDQRFLVDMRYLEVTSN